MGAASVLALLAFTFLTFAAEAADYMYQFNDAFSGAVPASPYSPWIDATFQTVTPGTVRLTVTNMTLTGSENVDQLYFNLNTNLKPTRLTFTLVKETGLFDKPKVSTGVNKFQADGDGKYDVLFNFNNGGTANNRFTAGESMTYYISGIPNLMASDFAFLSAPAGGAGPFYAAAHVQRIGTKGSLSGWLSATEKAPLPVPEPSATMFLSMGLIAWFAFHLGKRDSRAVNDPRLQLARVRTRETKRQKP